ncbi:MAG: PIN domain-containing protein [Candidatus Lokiarchaeota archaeon]|nr:PIN domain-containing protein [Candidatus Lokiarchaeota archaeon]
MKLIIDTNILISSLLKDSTTREILLNESLNFYLPEIVLSEVNKYLPYIIQKSELSEEEIKKLLNTLLENLILVPIDEYEKKMDEGMKIIGNIDEKDTQFIALALSIENDGIWSNDKHFEKQKKIKVFKAIDILNLLEELSKKE